MVLERDRVGPLAEKPGRCKPPFLVDPAGTLPLREERGVRIAMALAGVDRCLECVFLETGASLRGVW